MNTRTFIAVSLALALAGVPAAGKEKRAGRTPIPGRDQARTEAKAKVLQKEKEKSTPEQEKAKLFQLNPVVIDVVEKLRDKDVPNMTVVKTELFPMTIGVSLDSALERQAGVDVQRIQEVGTAVDDESIKIRGLGSRRIKVLRNGRALNSSGVAGGYFIDWTMIPLAGADRVEVVKGVGDPRYGNVLGGIINLVPKALHSERPRTEVQVSGASFATRSMNLFHGFKPGAFEYSISGGWTQSDGYLRNGGMNLGTANLHLGYDFPFRGRLTAELGYASTRKSFAVGNRVSKAFGDPAYGTVLDGAYPASDGEIMYGGMGATAEPGSWWKKTKWTVDAAYEQALGEAGYFEARYWQNHGDREAYNTRTSLNRVFHKMFYDDRSRGFSGLYRHNFPSQTVTVGIDYAHLKDDGDKNLSDDFRAPFVNGSYVSTKNLEFYAMDDIRLFGDALTVTPGARILSYEGVAGPAGVLEGIPDLKRSGWAPSLKLTWAPAGGESLFYASAARALRMPTAPEHFWHYDYDAGVDTSDLPFREEDGLLVQAGWRTTLPGGTQIEVAPYLYSIRHYIQFDLINFVAYNIDRVRITGVEAEISHSFGGGWSAFANYTYQSSTASGDPFIGLFVDAADRGFAEIPGLPAHKANLGLQIRTRSGLSAALYAQAVSSQKVVYNDNALYSSDLRVRTQDGYVRFDLEAKCPLGRVFEAGLFVRNLADVPYQERFGFPAAGRNAGLSLRAGF